MNKNITKWMFLTMIIAISPSIAFAANVTCSAANLSVKLANTNGADGGYSTQNGGNYQNSMGGSQVLSIICNNISYTYRVEAWYAAFQGSNTASINAENNVMFNTFNSTVYQGNVTLMKTYMAIALSAKMNGNSLVIEADSSNKISALTLQN